MRTLHRMAFTGTVLLTRKIPSPPKLSRRQTRCNLMEGKIFNSDGQYVADIRANAIYDLAGKRLYHLRGQKIYKPTGELVGHLNSVGGDRRLDKSTDRLFSKV